MLKTVLFTVCVLFLLNLGLNAQTKCACESDDGSNSATQSCPVGYVALCTCSAFGTNGQCSKQDAGQPEGLSRAGLAKVIESSNAAIIAKNLSVAFGKQIRFVPNSTKFVLDKTEALKRTGSHWDLFDYLAAQGKLMINGVSLDYWESLRDNLIKGGSFKVCTGKASAQAILNEINFYAGTRYKIIAGDPLAQKDTQVKGNSLTELIDSFTTSRSVTISEN